jgi:hypothetical protein
MEHKAIRRMALSERITDETRTGKRDVSRAQRNVPAVGEEIFSATYRAFGDALFLSLAETTIEFASHDPQRARDYRPRL